MPWACLPPFLPRPSLSTLLFLPFIPPPCLFLPDFLATAKWVAATSFGSLFLGPSNVYTREPPLFQRTYYTSQYSTKNTPQEKLPVDRYAHNLGEQVWMVARFGCWRLWIEFKARAWCKKSDAMSNTVLKITFWSALSEKL